MQITLPELGDGIVSGDVLEIFVSVGDTITAGQDIIEMETDKATVPVPSKVGGKITKIIVSEGETVPIGGALIEIEAVDAPEQEAPKAEAPKAEAPKAEAPKAEAPKPEPPKQASPAPAKQEPPKPAPPKPAAPIAPATIEQPSSSAGVIPAGPAVRKLARETNVNLANVQGTGPGGRITSDDVLAAVRVASSKPAAAVSGAASGLPRPARAASATDLPGTADEDEYGPIRVERMSKIRKTIATQMHASWSNVPRVTNFDDADISDLERLRQSSKDDYAAQGLKLTTMPFLIKAVATALRHHPSINAVIDGDNEQIIYKDYVNIGIAVDTDRGLIVPVMRDVDRMGIPDITRALAETSGKVRGGQFTVNDLKGGSFTISNLGAIGGTYSTPIVNIPEVAILLVGRSRKLPVVMPDDSIQPRLMMPLSLSYDHRLVDGGTAARFLNDVISYLEAPSRLLLAL